MVGVPTNFQAISNVLPTYNFVDIAAGTGFINFYAGNTVDLKVLNNYTYYSDAPFYSVASQGGGQADQLKLDEDYDVILNRPLDVRGQCILNVPVGLSCNSGAGNDAYTYIIAFIRKWDGAVETDLATNTSTVFKCLSASIQYSMLAIDLNVALTHFKIGETLRLTIRQYLTTTGVAGTCYYGHDPKNRSTGWDTTGAVPSQLVFQCPVRLNL